jgi:AcrR family transcriptional regulator
VLDAALEVFVDRGFASARLEDVAARAGVSKGTLYLYFDNKEELFKAVVRTSILPLIDEFRTAMEASQESGTELLAKFLHRWWTAYGNTRLSGVAKLCIAESGNFPEVARFWREEVIVANDAVVAAILRRGIERGEFRSVEIEPTVVLVMAPLVLRALMRDSLDTCCPGAGIEAHTLIDHHLDTLLRALAPDGAPRPLQHPGSRTDATRQDDPE